MAEKLRETKQGAVYGVCDNRFERVLDQFAHGFDALGEVGANVALTFEGELVVDLWGGVADPSAATPWEEDTVTTVFSCTKGITAIVAHMLAERGLLDIEAPVAEYWPEYGQNGKEKTTVRMMLDHTAGVPVLKDEVKPGGMLDWDYMISRVEAETPFFEPGTRVSYHGVTYAWTVGEVIRRAAKMSMSDFFKTEIGDLLGADFQICVSADEAKALSSRYAPVRQAKMRPDDKPSLFMQTLMSDPKSIPALFFLNTGGLNFNAVETREAEIGSANGISNGRALAKIYEPLAMGGERFVSKTTLSKMGRTSSATNYDGTLLSATRFGLGFMRSIDNRRAPYGSDSAVLGEAAFGHVGAGGSIGFADPATGLSFGYVMNQQGLGILLNERGQGLVDAAYRSLGFTANTSGAWLR